MDQSCKTIISRSKWSICVYIFPKLQGLNSPSRLFCCLGRLAGTNRHLVMGWGQQCWHRRENLPHCLHSGRSNVVSILERKDWPVFPMVEKCDTEAYHLSLLTLCSIVGSVGSVTYWTPLFSRRADYMFLCCIQRRSNLARFLLCMTHCTKELTICRGSPMALLLPIIPGRWLT